ncbi:hypothetical protein [Actinomadura sp. 3N508]|uniref:hypothetical protein n=1 Tax=Actinomadura sp. 3N508 TaxID=3375153 RepID=UPI003794C11F
MTMGSLLALAMLAAPIGAMVGARMWWRRRWGGKAGVPQRKQGTKGAPELQITLGARAYRWPFGLAVGGPAIGLLISASAFTNDYPKEAVPRTLVFYGGIGLLVGLAGIAWAIRMFRNRLIVTIGEDGIVLRRREDEATIPSSAVHAVGLTWPLTDPVWTTWYDPAMAPSGIDALTKVGRHAEEAAATLLRDRTLPAGWLEAAHNATTEILGGTWRVLDDRGQEVPEPPPRALFDAGRILVDGTGRYRNERGGALLAQACGWLKKKSTGGASFFSVNPNKASRSIALRDPHARTVLIINRLARTWGKERLTVLDADGKRLGQISGRRALSLRSADRTRLGTVRDRGGRFAVEDTAGREAASLRTKSQADDSRMWLEISPDCSDSLRPLVLALPIAVRVIRQVRSS